MYKIINGIRDELHTSLGKIEDLDLVSIVNSNSYNNTTKKVSVIGKELGATHILSGSGETFNGKAVLRLYLVEAATDNRNRTAQELKNIFEINKLMIL